mgnify:CR=1 FL=1
MVYLMRHGQDDETYVGGWSDVSLIPKGIKEVNDTALWIYNHLDIKRIECSDVKRAIETAEIVREVLHLPYQLNSHLREQNKGKLNGVRKDIAYADYADFLGNEITVDTVFPDGESLRDLYNRVKEYLEEIFKMEESTLLITHRGVINMIYYLLNKKDVDMNKKQFHVTTASVHELNPIEKTIKRIH